VVVGKGKLFWFFSVGFERWQKPNVLDRVVAFFVQMFNFSAISALLTTFCSYKKLAISKHKTVCHHKT